MPYPFFDPEDPLSYGNDLPQQGGITGTMGSYGPSDMPMMSPIGGDPIQGQDPSMGMGTGDPSLADIPDFSGVNSAPVDTDPFQFDMGDYVHQRMAQFHPDTTAEQAYNALLNQMPARNNPGIWRKIGATLAGLGGGVKEADQMLYAPFYNQMQDWQDRLKPTLAAANLERYNNQINRQAAYNEATDQYRNRKQDEVNRENIEKDKREQLKIKNQTARTNAYVYRQMHPQSKFFWDDEGNLVAVDPVSKKPEYVTDDDGDPVKTLSKQDQINLGIQGRLKEIAAQGANTIASDKEKGAQARQTKQTAPAVNPNAGKSGVNASPENIAKAELLRKFNIAQDIYNSHPEWQQYINIDPKTKTYQIKQPPAGTWFGMRPPLKAEVDSYQNMLKEFSTRQGANTNTSGNTKPGPGPLAGSNENDPNTNAGEPKGSNTGNPNSKGATPNAANPSNSSNKSQTDKRQRAIALLQSKHKLVNEDTIKTVMGRLP